VLPALSATIAQAAQILPDKLKDPLGLHPAPAALPSPNATQDSKPPQAKAWWTSLPQKAGKHPWKPAKAHPAEAAGQEGHNGQPSAKSKPMGQPAPKPEQASVPGSNIKPLTVEELFKRMPKQFQPKKPKFSLNPEEIRINPMQQEQECLGRKVKALPWDDHNVLNPFQLGLYKTE
jgi:hypothetical protein